MWLDIVPLSTEAKLFKEYDITPKPIEDYEVRVAVFETIVENDTDNELRDFFVRAFFDSNDAKETDTHYRCPDGNGQFNYRLIFPFKHPLKNQSYNL